MTYHSDPTPKVIRFVSWSPNPGCTKIDPFTTTDLRLCGLCLCHRNSSHAVASREQSSGGLLWPILVPAPTKAAPTAHAFSREKRSLPSLDRLHSRLSSPVSTDTDDTGRRTRRAVRAETRESCRKWRSILLPSSQRNHKSSLVAARSRSFVCPKPERPTARQSVTSSQTTKQGKTTLAPWFF